MLYVFAILSALLLGIMVILLKGKQPGIDNIKFRSSWLVLPAVILQTLSRLAGVNGFRLNTTFTILVQGIVFGLLFLVFWFNRRYLGLWFTGLGALLNGLVMMLNGGRMPVDAGLLDKANLAHTIELLSSGADNKHIIINAGTKLSFLSDVIYVPGFLGIGMPIVSIGDMIVAVGLFILCLELCIYSATIPNRDTVEY